MAKSKIMKSESSKELIAIVVMGSDDENQTSKSTAPAGIEIIKVIQRNPVKYRTSDLSKFILGAYLDDNDYDHFCCPGKMWWTNGVDDQEWLDQTFRLFESPEAIQENIYKTIFPAEGARQLNIYSLSVIDGEIILNLVKTLTQSSDPE